MKKVFLSVLIISALASCKKDKICYDCEFGTVNGVKPANQEYCGEMPHVFYDATGTPLIANCTLK